MSNEVDIVVKATDKSTEVFDKAGKSAKTYGEHVNKAGEHADKSEQHILGLKDAVDGTSAIMAGPASAGIGAYIQGWADLASGLANFILPALANVGITSLRTAASTAASTAAQLAAGAAAKALAAAQWLLNAAMEANPILLIVTAIAALAAGLVYAYQNSQTFRDIVNGAFHVVGEVVGWLKDRFMDAFGFIINIVGDVIGFVGNLVGGIANFITGGDDAANTADDMGSSQQTMGEKVKTATEEINSQIDALTDLANALLGARGGETSYYQSVDDATKALHDNGRTLDVHTDKGRKNRDALDKIASATLTWRSALEKANAPADQLARVTDQGRAALERTARQMGMSKSQAHDYAQQLLGIPKNISSTITTLYREIHEYDQIEDSRARKGGHSMFTGGVVGAAGGGPRSGLTMVGEYGRELVKLSPGSTVYPHGKTEAIMGGSGGPAQVVLELKSSGSRMDDLLLELLRGAVRVRGGNVQAVLGRG